MPTNIDLGTTPLRDPEGGDIYVDKDGNMVTIEQEEVFRQECIVALSTIRGEEAIDRSYGLPLPDMMKRVKNIPPETVIRMAIMDCLNNERIPMISESSVVYIRPEEDGNWKVGIIATSVNNNTFDIPLEVERVFQSITV